MLGKQCITKSDTFIDMQLVANQNGYFQKFCQIFSKNLGRKYLIMKVIITIAFFFNFKLYLVYDKIEHLR